MDLLTTILTCSLYVQGDSVVRAIAESTPEGNPYFVLDTALDLTQMDAPAPPKNGADAVARAQEILSRGGRPLLGLLEVPPAWLAAFGRGLDGAFDPCTNLAVGSAMLSAFDAECASSGVRTPARAGITSAARRACSLHKYEQAIGSVDFAEAVMLALRYQRPATAPVAEAPIFAAPSNMTWGPQQILVPLSDPASNRF